MATIAPTGAAGLGFRAMVRFSRTLILGSLATLHACGGGGGNGDAAPVATPPPPAPVQLALDASNYQGAMRNALEWGDSAFQYAKLGADVADRMVNNLVPFSPIFRCPVSGVASITLTDRNGNGVLNANDTLSLFLDRCVTDVVSATGAVRIQVTSAGPLGNGREYDLLVQIIDLALTSTVTGAEPVTINFNGSLDYSWTSDFDHYVLTFGEYRHTQAGQTQSVANLVVDYLQRYDTMRYDYLLQGTLVGPGNAGEFRVSTPLSLTGTIGSYPSAGRLGLTGAANSAARLSEEGTAATNSATVLVSVDTNGDGLADSEVPELAWTQLSPAVMFSSLRGRPPQGLLPIP